MNKLIIILLFIFFIFINTKNKSNKETFTNKKMFSNNHFKELKKRNLKVINTNIINIKNNKILYYKKLDNPDSIRIARDKGITSRILQLNNLPIPNYVSFDMKKNTIKELKKLIVKKKINYPLVLKPLSGNQGKGVILDIRNFNELKKEIIKLSKTKLKKKSSIIDTSKCMIEEFKQGNSYRIYMINNKIFDIICREKPFVVGNGKHTILQLINKFNKKADNSTVFPIKNYDKKLISSQISFKSIVPKNKKIVVSHIASRHNGGKIKKIPISKVHPDNIAMCKKIQKVIGLTINGIDYITDDISISWKKRNGFINEVNDHPAFSGHLAVNKDNLKKFYDKLATILKNDKSLWE
jgi:cyanophycin synthetase